MQNIILEHKRGFTLIELVIVIVLIGILSATVLPKFANLTTQARTAANKGAAGAFASAVGISHAAWLAAGSITGGTTVTLEGTAVNMSSLGWPNGGAAAGGAPTSTLQCQTIWNQILNNPTQARTAVGACTGTGPCYVITVVVVAGSNVCTYSLFSGGPTGTAVTPTTNITYTGLTGAVGSLP